MMTQIKHGIAFLLGGIYVVCFWLFSIFYPQNNLWVLLVALSAVLILTVLALASILTFFIKNWGKR